ncbi:endogenous retrovirus group K member 8 Gag polyprotein-like [Rattus norvegicus]|uniref:endogenous retrovirus group K member 8 Gag polyprotein-like n=1 Tax=Rattus norvegicus TaxID=10116 RepID=UPI002FD8393B
MGPLSGDSRFNMEACAVKKMCQTANADLKVGDATAQLDEINAMGLIEHRVDKGQVAALNRQTQGGPQTLVDCPAGRGNWHPNRDPLGVTEERAPLINLQHLVKEGERSLKESSLRELAPLPLPVDPILGEESASGIKSSPSPPSVIIDMESAFDPISARPFSAEKIMSNAPPNTPECQPNRQLYPSLQDLVLDSPPVSDACRQLTNDVTSLRHMVETRKEQVQLLIALRDLETKLTELTPLQSPQLKATGQGKTPNKKHKILAFPLSLRSGTKVPRDPSTPGTLEEEEDRDTDGDSEEETELHPDSQEPGDTAAGSGSRAARAAPGPPRYHYQPLDFKILEKLKTAVSNYGPVAPFTLALLESSTEGWLTPNEFSQLARAGLSGGDFVLWKSEMAEATKEIETKNRVRPDTRSWTAKKILGEPPFNTLESQMQFSPGLLAQIRQACLAAWKRLPPKSGFSSTLTKVLQGADEPYSSFVSRLTETAERLFGVQEPENPFIKQLAFENANSTCQDILKHHRSKPLAEYVRLCAGAGTSHAIGLAIGAALQNAGFNSQKTCFNCKQVGHFMQECPHPRQNKRPPAEGQGNASPMRALPTTLCPRCSRGRHWANECRSKTDSQGRPLPPRQSGNFPRGQPPAPSFRTGPGAIGFVPQQASHTSPNQSHPSPNQLPISGEPQRTAQDWTSVPPPVQY